MTGHSTPEVDAMEVQSLLQEALKGCDLKIVGIDPGETTGVAYFHGPNLIEAKQLSTGLMPDAAGDIEHYLNNLPQGLDAVVMESYRVYSWKAKTHAWAGLHTPRLIGAIEYICKFRLGVPLHQQSAYQGKTFCTDEKLQAWGLYHRGERHARDAIRHVCQHLLFTVAKVHERQPQPGGARK
jgi:hypothetical protein